MLFVIPTFIFVLLYFVSHSTSLCSGQSEHRFGRACHTYVFNAFGAYSMNKIRKWPGNGWMVFEEDRQDLWCDEGGIIDSVCMWAPEDGLSLSPTACFAVAFNMFYVLFEIVNNLTSFNPNVVSIHMNVTSMILGWVSMTASTDDRSILSMKLILFV